MTTVVHFPGSSAEYLRELVRRYWDLPRAGRNPPLDLEFIETFFRLP